jgi:hypothetical protein
MWWRIALEAALVVALLSLGSSFWGLAKIPSFRRRILADEHELERFIDSIGKDRLIVEGQQIQPVFGSSKGNIEFFEQTASSAYKRSGGTFFFVALACLTASYFLGAAYLVANVLVFTLPCAFHIPESAQNQVMDDLHTVALNISRWSQVDLDGCRDYCTARRPEFASLFRRVVGITESR